jgi:hypothetical protein
MSLYIKNGVVKSLHKIVLIKDDMQIFNPTPEMLKEDGWVEYIAENTLEECRQLKKHEILHYDSSDDINIFYIGDAKIWLDKQTRTGLMLRFQSEQIMGKTETSLWYDNIMYTLPLETAFNILYALEIYASACYDNTQQHIANIDKLTTKEEIENYDYTIGYPEHLKV